MYNMFVKDWIGDTPEVYKLTDIRIENDKLPKRLLITADQLKDYFDLDCCNLPQDKLMSAYYRMYTFVHADITYNRHTVPAGSSEYYKAITANNKLTEQPYNWLFDVEPALMPPASTDIVQAVYPDEWYVAMPAGVMSAVYNRPYAEINGAINQLIYSYLLSTLPIEFK